MSRLLWVLSSMFYRYIIGKWEKIRPIVGCWTRFGRTPDQYPLLSSVWVIIVSQLKVDAGLCRLPQDRQVFYFFCGLSAEESCLQFCRRNFPADVSNPVFRPKLHKNEVPLVQLIDRNGGRQHSRSFSSWRNLAWCARIFIDRFPGLGWLFIYKVQLLRFLLFRLDSYSRTRCRGLFALLL